MVAVWLAEVVADAAVVAVRLVLRVVVVVELQRRPLLITGRRVLGATTSFCAFLAGPLLGSLLHSHLPP